jgi:hypothetical protein
VAFYLDIFLLLHDFLEFAPMSRFKKEIHVGAFIITVVDVSNHHTQSIPSNWVIENIISKH